MKNEFIKLCSRYDSIFIYGAGIKAQKLYHIIQNINISISGFYVSDMRGNPEFIYNLPVAPIDSFINDGKSLVIVSIPVEREDIYFQILTKLKSLGISSFYSLSDSFYKYFEEKKNNRNCGIDYFNLNLLAVTRQDVPKVSLLLPSLNSAKYISETLDSVCGQSMRDIEILCIDSGSTDGTTDIIRQYSDRDNRIRLINFPLKSYGAQMNFGIREARGEYIGIVETDDYIAREMCEELYNHAIKYQADFVKADFDLFTDRFAEGRLFLKSQISRPSLDSSVCYSSKDYLSHKLPVDVFIWTGIYRRAWLLENNIVFQETPGAAYQDYGVRHQLAFAVNRGLFLDKSFYRYRRDNSASSMWSGKSALYNYNETAFLISLARERNWPGEYLSFLTHYFILNAIYPATDTMLFSAPEDVMKEAIENFRVTFLELINGGFLTPESAGNEEYLLAKMLIENPEALFQYLLLREEMRMRPLMELLDLLASKKQIVICGNEQFYSRLYATLRANGIDAIHAISNYSSDSIPGSYMGKPLDFPEKIVSQFPRAHYVLAGIPGFTKALQKRLTDLGIAKDNISISNMWLDPFRCFQPCIRSGDEYRHIFAKAKNRNLF